MSSDSVFVLPDGTAVPELEISIPVKGRVKVRASQFEERDILNDRVSEHEEIVRYHLVAPLPQRLASVLEHYKRIASDALEGSKSVRDDMLVYFRAMVIVLQSIVDDHLNHTQKNERINAAIGVVERSISSLRNESFNFADSTWRRSPDLMRWDGPERRLRERVRDLEAQIKELQERQPSTD
ncbi:MAG: hypothetical protein KGL39_58235 [Patescibacteria group bacterium]|nr:hypothetical protein [Patescibacteria group bacterium]